MREEKDRRDRESYMWLSSSPLEVHGVVACVVGPASPFSSSWLVVREVLLSCSVVVSG